MLGSLSLLKLDNLIKGKEGFEGGCWWRLSSKLCTVLDKALSARWSDLGAWYRQFSSAVGLEKWAMWLDPVWSVSPL